MSVWKDLQNKAAQGLAKAGQETQRQMSQAKLKVRLAQLRQKKQAQFGQLGEAVYTAIKAGRLSVAESSPWDTWVSAVAAIEQEEEEARASLANLGTPDSDPTTECPACAARVPEGSRYCSNCGASLF